MKGTLEKAFGYQGDKMSLPVRDVALARDFEDLFRVHHELVYRTAFSVTGSSHDAEDVLQTVFLRVLARGGDVEDVAQPAAYFRRAAVNAAVDVLRRRELHA